MNISSETKAKIESCLNEKIQSSASVGGGCIADSRIIKTESGHQYFLKSLSGAPRMFLKEANGLKELIKAKAIRVPKVLLAEESFLLLEHIETGLKGKDFFENFGAQFAQLHKHTSQSYGFIEDNYIGATPQLNIAENKEKTNWPEFYIQKRILPQVKFAERNGYVTPELRKSISSLESNIHSILGNSTETPSLLHGDLWGGNYMCDNNGEAVLIDPAVYYGHREADLAMTKMFGGFSQSFYESYQEEYPLQEDWQYREGLYLLYHYLNHLNLFGRSYYSECISLLGKYR